MVIEEDEEEVRMGEEVPSTKVAKTRLLKGSVVSFFPLCLGLEKSLGDFSDGLGEFFFLFMLWMDEGVTLGLSESELCSFSSSDRDCSFAKEIAGLEGEEFWSTSKNFGLFEFLDEEILKFCFSLLFCLLLLAEVVEVDLFVEISRISSEFS